MKRLLSLFLLFSVCQIFAQDANLDSAVKLFTDTKPIPYLSDMVALQPNQIRKAELSKMLSQELAAVEAIHKAHKDVDLSILLPFVGLTPNVTFAEHINLGELPNAHLAERRAKWPMFALILDMPGAAKSLEEYSLNDHNPLNHRLEAYQILAYADAGRLTYVASVLRKIDISGEDKENIRTFIDMVEKGEAGSDFKGARDYETK